MNFRELETENSTHQIYAHWGIPRIWGDKVQIFQLSKSQYTRLTTADSSTFLIFSNQRFSLRLGRNFRRVEYFHVGVVFLLDQPLESLQFFIFAEDQDRFMELGKLAVLSTVGLQNEIQGWARAHAGFFKDQDSDYLMFGQPGSGKSTFLFQKSKEPKYQVFADELCLLSFPNIDPIPLHFHIKKRGCFPVTTVSQTTTIRRPLKIILLGLDYNQRDLSNLKKFKSLDYIKWGFLFLIGDGLHQMAAFHLHHRYLKYWFKVLLIRVFELKKLIRGAEFYRMG